MAETTRLKRSGFRPGVGSVDQLLFAQGLDGVAVLLGGTAGLFGLAGQLPGGGDGHGRASEDDPAGWRGWVARCFGLVGRINQPLLPPRGPEPCGQRHQTVAVATNRSGEP